MHLIRNTGIDSSTSWHKSSYYVGPNNDTGTAMRNQKMCTKINQIFMSTVLRIRDPVHFYLLDPDPGSGSFFW
jgi:hypothetical protein